MKGVELLPCNRNHRCDEEERGCQQKKQGLAYWHFRKYINLSLVNFLPPVNFPRDCACILTRWVYRCAETSGMHSNAGTFFGV